VHHYVGFLFLINIVMVFGIWVRDAFFEKFDWEWLTKVGGYFGYKEELPAARFNAGQKLYLWLVFLLGLFLAITGLIDIFSNDSSLRLAMHSLHTIAAFILIMMVMVHVYLGVLANPGTLRGIFEGKVSKSWARKHHPLWKTEE
ncbi:MAG: formate dehydrogenase subunit gamma, partial [Deltaproteobacteria bacterium]